MQQKNRTPKLLSSLLLGGAALALVAWITPSTVYQMMMENELIHSIKTKLNVYNEKMPEDRMYLQFDKPMYEPGDNIWFSAFVRDGMSLKPSSKSDIVHVDFINPKGSVEKSIALIAKNGVAAGDFSLGEDALGGIYKIRAYTNWMKNDSPDRAFEKELQVQDVVLPALKMKLDFEKKAVGPGDEVVAKLEINTNENKPLANTKIKYVANIDGKQYLAKVESTDEDGLQYLKFKLPADLKSNDGLLNVMIDYNGSTESISRSIPIVLNKITLNLFPEGGDLVADLKSRVAFRALNEFSKPADVSGEIRNSKNEKVAGFSSFHMGMGAFDFTPKAGEQYHAVITSPENIHGDYPLPAALSTGFTMELDQNNHEIGVHIGATLEDELSLVAQVRGKMYYSTVVHTKKGENSILFPTSNFPIGVAQVTLFDSKGIARAERLVFVNKDKKMNISIEPEKQNYLPREKVKMTVIVKDERGLPMPANLSMAVVNDQFLSFADDKSGTILSELLLQQDLKDKVEEPAFYFDPKEEKADKALDYLLLTSGWRRFTWEKVNADEPLNPAFAAERAIVSGTVLDASTGKAVPHAKVKIYNGAEYEADENGRFIFNKLDLTNPVTLTFNANGYTSQSQYVQTYTQNIPVYLYDVNYYNRIYAYPSSVSRSAAVEMDDIPMAAAEGASVSIADESKHVRNDKFKAPQRPVVFAQNKEQNQKAAPVEQQAAKKDRESEKRELAKVNNRDRFFAADQVAGEDMNDHLKDMQQPAAQLAGNYYRARQFAAPVYAKDEKVEERTDFRNTIYWNPDLEVDRTGRKTVEFYASDDITSFKTTVEGLSKDGSIGRGEAKFFTQLPFAISTKIPVEVATDDNLSIPLTLKNNTDKPFGGILTIQSPDGLQVTTPIPSVQTIMPGAAKTIYLDYKVLDKIGYGDFSLTFKSCGLGDGITQKIHIAPKGFPANASFSGQEVDKEYSFEVDHLVNGSLRAKFTAFPNVVADLMMGVAGILQEPYGCFEQTSCTAYPNAMVLDYLKSTDSKDNSTLARATDLLNRGYKRLTTFEASEKGYEWFGANPGHEGLSAYGIMEFVDMKNAGGNVDQKMVDRTANWLLSHKDGKGGFNREQHAYHDFGRISNDILNAYIVYALSEAGYTGFEKEFDHSYNQAIDSKDPYMLAMMANAAHKLNLPSKAENAMQLLLSKQAKDGSFTGSTHSITYSQGQSLTIETTSLAILAMLKENGKNAAELNSAVHFIVGSRSGSGVFSSTQGTILALKALTEFAKFSKKTTEDGTIQVYVDGKKVTERSYKAGDRGAIEVDGLEDFIKTEGKHTVRVKYIGVKTPLPYSVAVNWSTALPASDKNCSIDLTTKLASTSVAVGETVRLTATITNKKDEEVPSTMAIIGIPAGFTVQPWQLKELQDKKVFDYYEIKGNNIAVYYRGMDKNASKVISLDLKAEMPGDYDAPASSAYLYYTNEYKTWAGMEKVSIRKKA